MENIKTKNKEDAAENLLDHAFNINRSNPKKTEKCDIHFNEKTKKFVIVDCEPQYDSDDLDYVLTTSIEEIEAEIIKRKHVDQKYRFDFPDFSYEDLEEFHALLENFDEKKFTNRIQTIINALNVQREDAEKILEHFTKHDLLEWIDDYDEDCRSREMLVDVHYESNFRDMINWIYEDVAPFDIIGKSGEIKDYPEMLQLEDKVIFWYGLVN